MECRKHLHGVCVTETEKSWDQDTHLARCCEILQSPFIAVVVKQWESTLPKTICSKDISVTIHSTNKIAVRLYLL